MSEDSIPLLKSRISELESLNARLLSENDSLKVELYSSDIIEYISMGQTVQLKSLITDTSYPINAYFSDACSERGHTPLTLSVLKNQTDIIKYLISDRKADVNKASKKDGWTALMYAVENKKVDLVKYLLECNADINVLDEDGFNVVAIAVDTHNEEMIKLLLDKKPQLNNKEVVVGLLEMAENENITKMIRNYYGMEITEEEEDTQNDAE